MAATKKKRRRVVKKAPAKTKRTAKKKIKKGESKTPKTLAEVRDEIRKRDAKSVVVYETDADTTPIYPSRFIRLNRLLGGSPCRAGAIIELYGLEDSGKSSSAIALAADVQRQAPPNKRTVVLVNFEGPQPYAWWRILGLDTSEQGDHPAFIQLRPTSLEQGMSDAIRLVETGEVCAVIFDSIYAASSKASRELLNQWGQTDKSAHDPAGISVEARQWGKAWNATKIIFMEHEVVVIAVNQGREDMETGSKKRKGWGNKKRVISSRGKALKFFAWVRLEMSGHLLVNEKNEIRKDVDGRQIRMRIIKNKTSGDDRGTVAYDLVRGYGFDLIGDLMALSIEAGVISGGGGGYYRMGSRQIRGKDNVRSKIEGSPRLQALLRQRIDAYLQSLPIEELDMSSIDDEDDE